MSKEFKVPSGTVQSLQTVFEKTNEFISTNISRRVLKLFESFGVVTNQINGVVQSGQNDLKVTLNTGLEFFIATGIGIAQNGEVLRVSSQTTGAVATPATPDKIYLVSLVYTTTGSAPVPAQNAFLYDKTGATPYSTKNTEFEDSYVLTLTDITPENNWNLSYGTDEILLGAVKVDDASNLLTTAWTFNGKTAVSGVIDLRGDFPLKFDHRLLDDTQVLFRDRPSTGSNAFDQAITFTGAVNLDGDISLPGITNEVFRIGKGTLGPGGIGLPVATLADAPKPPLNLRIYDINPYHADNQAKRSEVIFKWNWENLLGTSAPGKLTITGAKTGSMALNVQAAELAGYVIFCANFAPANNRYMIQNNLATVAGSTEITIVGIGGGEDPNSSYPAIILNNGSGLKLKIVPNVAGNDVARQAELYELDNLFLTDQTFSEYLTLEQTYSVYLKTISGMIESNYALMSGGSYDPDHTGGGQADVTYTSPFTNMLPNLDDTGAELSVLATNAGFEANLAPGGWVSGGEADQTAHEFEWAYKQAATGTTIDWADTTDVILQRQASKKFVYAASDNARYVVGVRPIQNRQAVSAPPYLVGSVVSGSGGRLPSDVPLINGLLIRMPTGAFTSLTDMGFDSRRLNGITMPTISGVAPGTGGMGAVVQNWLYSGQHVVLVDSASAEWTIDLDFYDWGAGSDTFTTAFIESGSAALGAGTFGTSESGRFISSYNSVPHEYIAVEAELQVFSIKGATENDSLKVRVYQNTVTGKAQADVLNVWAVGTYVFPVDFQILNTYGTLSWGVDCWDPANSGANNTAALVASLTVYFRILS